LISDISALFRSVLSTEELITDPEIIAARNLDWRGRYRSHCTCLLRPCSLESVQKIMHIAYQHRIAITPQGGHTGLCGGGIPSVENSAILLLEGLNRVRKIFPLDRSVVVEAGCILANVQQYVQQRGFYFPIRLASEGSCQIGGNIACNAGGVNVLRYGTMRDQVLGLEVVLPNGELMSHLTSLHKNTTGFDSKHLWIGSEGTLGVITAATLKLYPVRSIHLTLLLAAPGLSNILDLLVTLQQYFSDELTSFEYMEKMPFIWSCALNQVDIPLKGEVYVLCEFSLEKEEDRSIILQRVLNLLLSKNLQEVLVATRESEAHTFWRIRESISQAQKKMWGVTIKHDIALPITFLASFIASAKSALQQQFADAQTLLFGHLGDGSLHYDVALERDHGPGIYQYEAAINEVVYNQVLKYHGTIAAEHGVGQLKRQWLKYMRSQQEIALMRHIKKQLDDRNIMNPGKILPDH
jgi:hypothetical protein